MLPYGAALTPVTLAGAWAGKKVVNRASDHTFVVLVETGLLFLIGFS